MELKEFLVKNGIEHTEADGEINVGGSLDLRGTGITSLPEGLTVGGYLDLENTGITSLPEGLTVGGSLDLRGTGITSLPEGLTVGGSLYLENTGITSLPEGLTVGGYLYPPTEELKISDSIGVGIKTDRWNVELKNGILTIGCQSHRIKKWRSMTDDDLRNLDSGAINFCRSHRAIIESFISKYPDHCVEK